ncbi:MAG: hypothetical protein AABX88_00710 [Nanoarchaeota archaeon]
MAPKISKEVLDYFKYDNAYWNKERKNSLKKRIITYFLLPTIIFSGICIAKKEYIWRVANSTGETIQRNMEEISEDFPYRAQAHFNLFLSKRKVFGRNELNALLDNQFTESNIKNLMEKDEKTNYSEIGGGVIIDKQDGKEYLKFIDVETEDMRFSKKIISKLDDKEYLKNLFSSDEGEKMFEKFGVGDEHYETIINYLRNGKWDEKKFDWLAKTYLFLSDNHYKQTDDESIKLFYLKFSEEETIGSFHIHARGGVPSKPDLENSKNYERRFVLSNRGNGYTLYELIDGKIHNEISKDFKY